MSAQSMYGFQDDNVPVSGGGPKFGLNAGVAKLIKFEWIGNAGAGGTEGEALDIKFQVGDKEISYRKFPITRAFGKNNEVITDPSAPEMLEEGKNLSAVITHILHCFVNKEAIQAAFSVPMPGGFKQFCQIAMNLLPPDYATKPLDIFFQYQWQFGKGKEGKTNTVTFLEIPAKMNQGKWLAPLRDPAPGVRWEEVRDLSITNGNALYYQSVDAAGVPVTNGVDAAGVPIKKIHPFGRTAWFLQSNYANQQKVEGAANNAAATNTGVPPVPPPVPPVAGQAQASGWD